MSTQSLQLEWESLSEQEINDVVIPALQLLDPDRLIRECSQDLLIRCCRRNPSLPPLTKNFQAYVPRVGNQVAALADILDGIMSFRGQTHVQANALLTRQLNLSDRFHKCWPQSVCGKDIHGHYIMCERIANVDVNTVTSLFTIDDILLHTSQRAEAFQLMQTKESIERFTSGKKRAFRHVHIVDLSGITLFQFMKMKSTLIPVFRHYSDQYPNTLFKLFAINAPSLFAKIWGILKGYLDADVAAKVNILSAHETQYSEQRFREAGIEKDQLPPWLFEGACGNEVDTFNLVQDAIKENVFETQVGTPLHNLYYPPLNKTIAARLSNYAPSSSSSSSTTITTTTTTTTTPPITDLNQHHMSAVQHSVSTNNSNSDSRSYTNKVIIFLLVLVLVLLVFIAWHQVMVAAASQQQSQRKIPCSCSCAMVNME